MLTEVFTSHGVFSRLDSCYIDFGWTMYFIISTGVHPFVTKSTTTTAASIATTKSTASTNAWPIDIAATSDLLLPEGSQRLRHVNSLALPSRAHSLSSNLLARRKYLPKLKGNIPMQVKHTKLELIY